MVYLVQMRTNYTRVTKTDNLPEEDAKKSFNSHVGIIYVIDLKI